MFLLSCDRRDLVATITPADIISLRSIGDGAELCCVCVCGLPVTVHIPRVDPADLPT